MCFVVRDLDKALDFYEKKLGLKHGFDFVNDKGERFGVYLQAGNRTFIELFTASHEDPDESQSYRHVCFEVDNIEATVGALKAQGVDTSPVTLGGDHSWQSWLADPDGNRIELHAYTPESKQTSCGG